MFCMLKKETIYPAYVSKHNSNCKKQIIILMFPNEGLWHYLAVTTLAALLWRTTSKNHDDFYCMNCLHFFATENKCESHKKVHKNKDFCNIVMPSEDTKILKFNQYKNIIKNHLLSMHILNV